MKFNFLDRKCRFFQNFREEKMKLYIKKMEKMRFRTKKESQFLFVQKFIFTKFSLDEMGFYIKKVDNMRFSIKKVGK